MASIRVFELVFTDTGEDKLWSHGITTVQAQSVLLGRVVVTRNRAGRTAPYVLIGHDEHGRCLTLPIVPTDQWGEEPWNDKGLVQTVAEEVRGRIQEELYTMLAERKSIWTG